MQQVSGKIGCIVRYIQPKDECTFIHIEEVFITNIELDNFQMGSDEYQSILAAL